MMKAVGKLLTNYSPNGSLRLAFVDSLMLCGSVLNAPSLRIGIGRLDTVDEESAACGAAPCFSDAGNVAFFGFRVSGGSTSGICSVCSPAFPDSPLSGLRSITLVGERSVWVSLSDSLLRESLPPNSGVSGPRSRLGLSVTSSCFKQLQSGTCSVCLLSLWRIT